MHSKGGIYYAGQLALECVDPSYVRASPTKSNKKMDPELERQYKMHHS